MGGNEGGRSAAQRAVTVCWIFPDRGSARQRDYERRSFWDEYAAAAAHAGMRVTVAPPEAVEMTGTATGVTVRVDGDVVTPEDTIFVTELYSFPHQERDLLALVTTFKALEAAGFYLPVPPDLSCVMNDKLAALLFLRGCPVPPIPTARVVPGRDLDERDLDRLVDGFSFPVVVKPSNWGSGLGVTLARDRADLRALLGLASGAECPMVVQPFLGHAIEDYRIFFVRGKPHTVAPRSPRPGDFVANVARGGASRITDLPVELEAACDFVARAIALPYFCVDFIYDGRSYWLSEVELDGAVAVYLDRERLPTVLYDRFLAYADAHRAWLEARGARNDRMEERRHVAVGR